MNVPAGGGFSCTPDPAPLKLCAPSGPMDLQRHLQEDGDLDRGLVDVFKGPDSRALLVSRDDAPSDPWLAKASGTVVDLSARRVVAFPGERSLRVAPTDLDDALGPPDGAAWYPYGEGTRVQLYHWDGAWRLSTSRVVDAYASHYFHGAPSFGAQFDLAAEQAGLDRARLDPGRSYAFVVRTPDTPAVTRTTGTSLLHIGTHDLATLTRVEQDLGVPRPDWLPVAAWEDLQRRLTGPLHDGNLGALVRTADGRHVRVVHPSYDEARSLVADDHDAQRTAVSVALSPSKRQQYLRLFKDPSLLRAADQRLDEAVRRVFDLYVDYNVRRVRVRQPKPVYETLKALHARFGTTTLDYGDVDAHVRSLTEPQALGLLRHLAPETA